VFSRKKLLLPEECLFRLVSYPLTGFNDLRRIVSNDLHRFYPFHRGKLSFTFRIIKKNKSDCVVLLIAWPNTERYPDIFRRVQRILAVRKDASSGQNIIKEECAPNHGEKYFRLYALENGMLRFTITAPESLIDMYTAQLNEYISSFITWNPDDTAVLSDPVRGDRLYGFVFPFAFNYQSAAQFIGAVIFAWLIIFSFFLKKYNAQLDTIYSSRVSQVSRTASALNLKENSFNDAAFINETLLHSSKRQQFFSSIFSDAGQKYLIDVLQYRSLECLCSAVSPERENLFNLKKRLETDSLLNGITLSFDPVEKSGQDLYRMKITGKL